MAEIGAITAVCSAIKTAVNGRLSIWSVVGIPLTPEAFVAARAGELLRLTQVKRRLLQYFMQG